MPIDVLMVPEANQTYLYNKYVGNEKPQECFLEIDFVRKLIQVLSNLEPAGRMPARVVNGEVLWFRVPILCSSAANQLANATAEIATQLIETTRIETCPVTGRMIHHRTEDGNLIMEQLEELSNFACYAWEDEVSVVDAGEFFNQTIKELPDWVSLPLSMPSDREIQIIANQLRKEFPKDDYTGGWLMLENLENFLRNCVYELQDLFIEGKEEAKTELSKTGSLQKFSNLSGKYRNFTDTMSPQMFAARRQGMLAGLIEFRKENN